MTVRYAIAINGHYTVCGKGTIFEITYQVDNVVLMKLLDPAKAPWRGWVSGATIGTHIRLISPLEALALQGD